MTNARIVAAAPNSGTGWLANMLLEANVPVSFAMAEKNDPTWNVGPDGWTISPAAFLRLRGILPALHRRAKFTFPDEAPRVRVEHIFEAIKTDSLPTIVVIRDPRDSMYSAGSEYLQAPLPSDPLGLTPPQAWAVQTLLWSARAQTHPVLLVRYEDMLDNAEHELTRVLSFLGVQRSAKTIAQAVSVSEFSKAKATLETAAQAAGAVACYPREGKAGLWRERLTPTEAAHFDGLTEFVLSQAGYDTPGMHTVGTGGFAALQAQAPPDAQRIFARVEADRQGGNTHDALRRLAETISPVPGSSAADAPLLAALVALRWTHALLGENAQDTDTAQTFDLLCDLHASLANAPSVRALHMRELTQQVPAHAGAYNIWGKIMHAQGRHADAERVFAAACEAGAETAQMRSNLAVLAWQDGRHAEALSQIARAAQLDPHEPGVLANLAAMETTLLAA